MADRESEVQEFQDTVWLHDQGPSAFPLSCLLQHHAQVQSWHPSDLREVGASGVETLGSSLPATAVRKEGKAFGFHESFDGLSSASPGPVWSWVGGCWGLQVQFQNLWVGTGPKARPSLWRANGSENQKISATPMSGIRNHEIQWRKWSLQETQTTLEEREDQVGFVASSKSTCLNTQIHCLFVCLFVLERGSHVTQAGLRLNMYLNIVLSAWPSCLSLRSTGITGMHHHVRFKFTLHVSSLVASVSGLECDSVVEDWLRIHRAQGPTSSTSKEHSLTETLQKAWPKIFLFSSFLFYFSFKDPVLCRPDWAQILCVADHSLKLLILCLLSPKYWDYRSVPNTDPFRF